MSHSRACIHWPIRDYRLVISSRLILLVANFNFVAYETRYIRKVLHVMLKTACHWISILYLKWNDIFFDLLFHCSIFFWILILFLLHFWMLDLALIKSLKLNLTMLMFVISDLKLQSLITYPAIIVFRFITKDNALHVQYPLVFQSYLQKRADLGRHGGVGVQGTSNERFSRWECTEKPRPWISDFNWPCRLIKNRLREKKTVDFN